MILHRQTGAMGGDKIMDMKLALDFICEDDRGRLIQLAHEGYAQINVLISNKGVRRGGHYHKISKESFFVISGSVEVTTNDQDGKNVQTCLFSENDFFRIQPNLVHSMFFPQDCVMVGMYDVCIEKGNGEKDIYPYPGKTGS